MTKELFRGFLLLATTMMMSVAFTACSDDDDDDNGGGNGSSNGGTEYQIPASVVDGVRVSELQTADQNSAISVNYNEDGSPSEAYFGGNTYTFEYAQNTRGTGRIAGRNLTKIVCTSRDSYGSTSHEATNFKFNDKGFLVSCKETIKETESYNGQLYYEGTVTINQKFSYNADNRISKINMDVHVTEYDEEDGKDSYSFKMPLSYTYSGGSLSRCEAKAPGVQQTITFGYANAPENHYNLMTPHMALGIAEYSPVLFIMTMLGHVGNASASLPTKLDLIYVDEEEEERETASLAMSYTLDSDKKLRQIVQSGGGAVVTYNYYYFTIGTDAASTRPKNAMKEAGKAVKPYILSHKSHFKTLFRRK